MSKATTIKEALVKFEEKTGKKADEAEVVELHMQVPPLEKMDASLSTLTKCVHLKLSTNAIEKIANLNGLKNLKILSLGRNNIKLLTGLEAVSETLEELWISYNIIEKLKGISVLKKLKVLYMCHNRVSDQAEFNKLSDLAQLEELVFHSNPLHTSGFQDDSAYQAMVQDKLPRLKKLDGTPCVDPADKLPDQQQQQMQQQVM